MGHRNFLAATSAGSESQFFKAAMKDPSWQEAMHNEIQALENNGTWRVTDLPPGKKALGSRGSIN